KGYNTKMNKQFHEFRVTKLYSERNALPSYITNGDTTKAVSDSLRFNSQALFNSLSLEKRVTALTKSIENLQDASNFLVGKNETMKASLRSIKRYEVDWHKKLTLPFACLVFFLIGAPLGAIIRKGGLGTPAVISIFFFILWYVITISGEKLVEEGLLSSTAGMWASSFLLLPIGIFLTYKASTDSVILNIDTYLAFFRKIRDYLYRVVFQSNPENKSQQDE
ncbi:MAG: LptF/LptG family permease, partial [Bacteroidia bacterium]|nr:LptF/LptG family permease [Bacteroidia bacterium]